MTIENAVKRSKDSLDTTSLRRRCRRNRETSFWCKSKPTDDLFSATPTKSPSIGGPRWQRKIRLPESPQILSSVLHLPFICPSPDPDLTRDFETPEDPQYSWGPQGTRSYPKTGCFPALYFVSPAPSPAPSSFALFFTALFVRAPSSCVPFRPDPSYLLVQTIPLCPG